MSDRKLVYAPGEDGAPIIEGRPLPEPGPVSTAYWEAAARGEVLFQECPACGNRQHYPRLLCTKCGDVPEWRTSSGKGTVHTYTIVRQNHASPFKESLPYVVAMIELEEGPKLMGGVTHCVPDDVHVGMPVEVYSVFVDDSLGIHFWRPAA